MHARRRLPLLLFCAVALGLASCHTPSTQERTETAPVASAGVIAPATGILRVRGWVFNESPGRIVETANYRLHSTIPSHRILERYAEYLEVCLAEFRTTFGPLPEPERRFDTYLFGSRSEWQDFTREFMNDSASPFLNLGRGGYATRGTAVLYDLGPRDTLAIMAHEGWHQYTQVTFRHALPVWLEESIATYMEGRAFEDGTITFDPWQNPQRRTMLRRAVEEQRMIPLIDLINRSPQFFLQSDQGELLVYYAQLWALAHFLVEGEDERYADGLRRLLQDAAAGRLVSTIVASPDLPAGVRRQARMSHLGPAIVTVYFNRDFLEFERGYLAYVRALVEATPSTASDSP